MLSVVIPTYNEERALPRTLESLVPAAAEGMIREVIVVDGGSTDATCDIADASGARVVTAPPGRGGQLAAGAGAARAGHLLFLHADTSLEASWSSEIRDFFRDAPGRAAAFRFALDDEAGAARRLEVAVALRCKLFGLPYGDQGLAISRALYDEVGGFRAMPLFEDVDFVRRLGRRRLSILHTRAVTSADRYRENGYLKRSAKNAALLARYLLGAPPEQLARAYD